MVRAAKRVNRIKYSTVDCPCFLTLWLFKYFFKLITNPYKKEPGCCTNFSWKNRYRTTRLEKKLHRN